MQLLMKYYFLWVFIHLQEFLRIYYPALDIFFDDDYDTTQYSCFDGQRNKF